MEEYHNLNDDPFVTQQDTKKQIRLPIIKFTFPATKDFSTLNNLKVASKRCPNVIVISSNTTYLSSFMNNLKDNLTRKASYYVLIFEAVGRFSVETFFEDVSFFKKVLNLFLVVISKKSTFTTSLWDMKSFKR